ncbi:MAG: hypothetical protein LAO07_11390, partial [Acidobacteriia bacterium]|nr:hypothetical protein [Terriglobia bacterium]
QNRVDCNQLHFYNDITGSSSWTSSYPSIATVNNSNHKGLATGVSGGTTTIVAQFSTTNYQYIPYSGCRTQPVNGAGNRTCNVRVPYSAAFITETNHYSLNQTDCAARSGPPGSQGFERWVRLELRDQAGLPIAKSGIQMADGIQIGSPNDLGIAGGQTANTPTDSAGRWLDRYFVCSTACPASPGETDALQYWGANGIPLGHVNAIMYKCAWITVDGN